MVTHDKYDIVFCNFPYKDIPNTTDAHPAIVLGPGKFISIMSFVTSKVDKYKHLSTSYVLKDWKAEGLLMPSLVRADYQDIIDHDRVIFKIGHLTDRDILGLEEVLQLVPTEDRLDILDEDTIKQDGKWVNKGDEGTHGEFDTKKEADAQRKAMFASGWKGK